MNKTKLVLTAILLLGLATMQAKSNAAQDTNTVKSVELPALLIHFHPASTLYSLSSLFAEKTNYDYEYGYRRENDVPVLLYLTLEKPLSQSSSLIIRPSFWSFGRGFYGYDKDSVIRIGTDIGVRYYLSDSEFGDGIYLGGTAGLFYFKCKEEFWIGDGYKYEPKNSLWFDVAFYVGKAWKFSGVTLSLDAALGINLTNNLGGVPFIGDVNFCVGIPLSSKK
ncbi:MAG: hypothetical protein FWC41_06585 [Firmicutes bacterium]|nr:hypothetical protein [Bacillota bacterium]